jgi:hypothetical protein
LWTSGGPRDGPGPWVHGGPGPKDIPQFNLDRPLVIGRPGWPTCGSVAVVAQEGAVRGGALPVARRRRRPGGYSAPKHMRFGPGGRGERREANQVLDDGGGAVERTPRPARRAVRGRRAAEGAAVRGKIRGGGGELAHRRGNELETAWALGKRRWRRSTSASGGRRRRRRSVHGSVGGEEKSSGTPGPRANGADVGRR